MSYKFNFDGQEYDLNDDKLNGFFNDEVNPINAIDESNILQILNDGQGVDFSKSFYSLACEDCKDENFEKKKAYEFLEFHFYIYTKDGDVVTTTIDKDHEENSYDRLYSIGKVNNSYIVSVIACKKCGTFDIEIEELEM
ncbi:MAG: DUF3785 family protein [Clostridium sp.]